MKKVFTIFLLLATVTAIGLYIFYKVYMPKMVAEVIVSDEPPPNIFPEKIKKGIVKARNEIDAQMDDVPDQLKKNGSTFDDLIRIVELADEKEVRAAVNELMNTEIKSEDQVFDIGLKHVHIDGYDLEAFRSIFKEKATIHKIKRGVLYIENNNLMTTISVPLLGKL